MLLQPNAAVVRFYSSGLTQNPPGRDQKLELSSGLLDLHCASRQSSLVASDPRAMEVLGFDDSRIGMGELFSCGVYSPQTRAFDCFSLSSKELSLCMDGLAGHTSCDLFPLKLALNRLTPRRPSS